MSVLKLPVVGCAILLAVAAAALAFFPSSSEAGEPVPVPGIECTKTVQGGLDEDTVEAFSPVRIVVNCTVEGAQPDTILITDTMTGVVEDGNEPFVTFAECRPTEGGEPLAVEPELVTPQQTEVTIFFDCVFTGTIPEGADGLEISFLVTFNECPSEFTNDFAGAFVGTEGESGTFESSMPIEVVCPAPGLDPGDIDCEKTASDADLDGDEIGTVVQGEPIVYEVRCDVLQFADMGPEGPIFDELAITDLFPDNFDIDFAVCRGEVVAESVSEDLDASFPAQRSGQFVACSVTPLSAGSALTLVVEGTFNEAPCGTIKNIANAEYGFDTEVAEAVIFLECFDAAVTKTASTVTDSTGATVLAGGTIVYVIEVCNVAPAPSLVNNVFFFDQLPLGTEFQSSASADFDLAFDATSSQILGTTDQMQAGECGVAVITASVADDAPCGTPLTNLAVAGSATGIISDFPFDPTNFVVDEDADPSDNEATVTTTVVCPDEDEDGDDGKGPSVGTGDSGLLGESAVAGWQLGLLSLLIVGSLSGAYAASRRVR